MGKWVNSVVHAVTVGLVDLNKDKKASGAPATALEEEKKNSTRKRKALYGTQGGVLGQEVNQVGLNSRGNIFGN
jgi:hypothetical protein